MVEMMTAHMEQALLTNKNTTGKVVDHLGLVMATIDRLGLIKAIDERLEIAKEKGAKSTHGERVAAMIMNGLGFMDQRLYMFPDFLENKPVKRLLGEHLLASYFNDAALGRTLDKIHEEGVTKLFSDLAFKIGAEQGLLGSAAHFDTTSLSLFGDYEGSESQEDTLITTKADEVNAVPKITYGYSKDHRPDLRQVVLNLATTGKAGFPIWMEAHSGNASDQKVLREAAERMQKFSKQLKEAPSFIYVADSAMYASCLKKGGDLRWLSRVPERTTWSKALLQKEDTAYTWRVLENGYRICIFEGRYQNVTQRFCLVSSEQAYHRENKTFNKGLEKRRIKAEKALWHLGNQVFSCEKDAEKAVKAFNKTLKYYQASAKIEPLKKYKNRGHPKKGELPKIAGYQVIGTLFEQKEVIHQTRLKKGRFLLATNEFDREKLPDEQLLKEYKEQSKTESGFRFIKDDAFEVDAIFLKKPSRIAALMMVMTLCLMVYKTAEYQLREALKEVPLEKIDPDNKLRRKLTIKRVFKLFHGVHEITVRLGEQVQCLIINLNELLCHIIAAFGKKAKIVYGV